MQQPKKQRQADAQASIGEMDYRDAFNVVKAVAHVIAMWFMPFLRTNEGCSAYAHAWVSLIVMLAFTRYCPPLLFILPIWVLALIGKRIGVDRLQHSLFGGLSILTKLVRKELLARILEPLVLLAIGLACHRFSKPFGEFFFAGSIALTVILGVEMHEIMMARRRNRDARVEMEFQARISRGESGW